MTQAELNQALLLKSFARANLPTDDELVARAQQGSLPAIAALMQRYCNRIHNFVRSMGATDLQAEEVTNLTLDRIQNRIAEFQARSSFSSWALAIARNEWLRHSSRLAQRTVQVDLAECCELACSAVLEPQEIARRRRRVDFCLELIKALPKGQQEAIKCCYLDGLSLEEAAQLLGKNRPAVAMAVARGIRRMRQLARRKGGDWL